MKKFYISFLSLAFIAAVSSDASGQLSIPGVNPMPVNAITKHNINPSPMTTHDTLWPPVFTALCFTTDAAPYVYYNWAPPAQGTVTGNCNLPQLPPADTAVGLECAQRYSFGNGTISEVLVMYAYAVGATGNTSVKIYTINANTKKPQSVLGTSAIVSMADVITGGGYTSYMFSTPVPVTNFAVSAVFPTNGDTVAVTSTKMICNSVDSLGSIRFASPYGWELYSRLFNRNNVRDSMLDVMIFPIVDNTSGVNEYPGSNGLTLLGAYPNPANHFTNIKYSINESSIVSVNVFDLSGRVVLNSTEQLSAGNHEIKVSLKDIPSGNYYYTIKTDRGTLTSKFVVAK